MHVCMCVWVHPSIGRDIKYYSFHRDSHILVIALLEVINIIIIQPKANRVQDNQLAIKWSPSGYLPDY